VVLTAKHSSHAPKKPRLNSRKQPATCRTRKTDDSSPVKHATTPFLLIPSKKNSISFDVD